MEHGLQSGQAFVVQASMVQALAVFFIHAICEFPQPPAVHLVLAPTICAFSLSATASMALLWSSGFRPFVIRSMEEGTQ